MDWKFSNSYLLGLMTLGYIVGEIAHFLINTTSRAVAREIHFGNLACYANSTYSGNETHECIGEKTQSSCLKFSPRCEWNYNGRGVEYQVLSGPAFVVVFTVFCIIVGFTSDKLRNSSFGRHRIMGVGILTFSLSCFLMGLSSQYWHLALLRMGIAAGEAVCRPISGGIIADAFSPSARSLANGIFSWGVYFGYGLAYVIGINLTAADVLGYGWRAPYVISAIPGFVIAILLMVTVKNPVKSSETYNVPAENDETSDSSNHDDGSVVIVPEEARPEESFKHILIQAGKSFLSPEMLLLLLAAIIRQFAGLAWAFNTNPYFQTYYPNFDTLSIWLLAASIGGGGFGVFFGGFLSDRLVRNYGLHSRLWILGGFQFLAVPWAALVLYLQPPYALITLIVYYFCSETWFAILFTVITEICKPEVKSASIAIFLFIMNNIGGNLQPLFSVVSESIGLRNAIYLFWPGCVGLCGLVFLVASIPLVRRSRQSSI